MRQLLPGVLPLAVANEQIGELWTCVQTGVINFSSGVWLCVVVWGGVWLCVVVLCAVHHAEHRWSNG